MIVILLRFVKFRANCSVVEPESMIITSPRSTNPAANFAIRSFSAVRIFSFSDRVRPLNKDWRLIAPPWTRFISPCSSKNCKSRLMVTAEVSNKSHNSLTKTRFFSLIIFIIFCCRSSVKIVFLLIWFGYFKNAISEDFFLMKHENGSLAFFYFHLWLNYERFPINARFFY